MRKICVFTGTRAEYGLLKPIMAGIRKDPALMLQLIVSGMHLSPEFGNTFKEIEADGFTIDEKVEMLLSSNSAGGISKAMGLGLIGFSSVLERLAPDIVVVLGDRFEVPAMAQACLVARVPLAHLHGGEITLGAFDDSIRHAITKMSHLHFTSCEVYRRRVIQLGEYPDRVYNVGAIGIENIRNLTLLDRQTLAREIDFDLAGDYFLITFHPVTLEDDTAGKQFKNLVGALDGFALKSNQAVRFIFTKANADTQGRTINGLIDTYVADHPDRATAFTSMGQLRYLSAMQYAAAVVGNSSSGILEAPAFKVPAVNIGDRQKGRVRAESVIDCEPDQASIQAALERAVSKQFRDALQGLVTPYEKPGTVKKIIDVLKTRELNGLVKKEFYDIE